MRQWKRVGERSWVLSDDEIGPYLADINLLDEPTQPLPVYRVTGELVGDEPVDFATLVTAQVFVEALAARCGSGGTR